MSERIVNETITVERKKLEELLADMTRTANCRNDTVYIERFHAVLNSTPVMTKADWQRVISEKFYLHGSVGCLLNTDGIHLTAENLIADPLKIVREKGIRQPHFKGHPHPEGKVLVEVYRYSEYNDNVPERLYAENVVWYYITEYIVL